MARKTPISTPKAAAKPNTSILSFFKKEPIEQPLFVPSQFKPTIATAPQDDLWEDNKSKRRKLSGEFEGTTKDIPVVLGDCTPPPSNDVELGGETRRTSSTSPETTDAAKKSKKKRRGPFIDESDSEFESEQITSASSVHDSEAIDVVYAAKSHDQDVENIEEAELPISSGDFEDFEGLGDFEDDQIPEELRLDQEFIEQQISLEREKEGLAVIKNEDDETAESSKSSRPFCPICSKDLAGVSEEGLSVHVNECLDRGGESEIKKDDELKVNKEEVTLKIRSAPVFRSARPGQKDPSTVSSSLKKTTSAFSKIMSSHAEDAAWATAASAEVAARGKPAYERMCPFYKIMPGYSITVDAFRYGAVEGCQAYFLSHFHSDHYIGLTARWEHGPIYCSKVTANLVIQQLRVDKKWVVPLEFEQQAEVPDTGGVKVTMISANHCPGSSLFLFEKQMSIKGRSNRLHRILHCGDFRACRAHLEHPLLKPTVTDTITRESRQQKIDVCYLDTTYLNPKYAFPPQDKVINACAAMCVKMNASTPLDAIDSVRGEAKIKSFMKTFTSSTPPASANNVSRLPHLLVVVGTYSIGKERICIGIARALNTKIYAPPAKMRICNCLEDPELASLLTADPRKAQVHMTPLFEIRGETLDEYLTAHADTFTHAVGFRPTGWTYRPPGTRFVESPSVALVLRGVSWATGYGVGDLVPQRGSTKRSTTFGVPYSEHSSFRELTAFCCALRIDKVVPTVNVGNAKSRERMRAWVEKWDMEKRKNGLFDPKEF
jgi:DNA cross-link repair 1A protein